MRLGLLGGTFDPIHRGHLAMVRAALARGLERVVLVPSRRPPHKNDPGPADPFHRFALAALAAMGEERLGTSTYEMMREEPSYTVQTVRHFVSAGHDVALIMGSDTLAEIDTWRNPQEIVDQVAVLVYPRRPHDPERLRRRLPAWIGSRLAPDAEIRTGRVILLDGPFEDISSTLVRERLSQGLAISDLVTGPVEEYIRKNRLYAGAGEGAD